MEAASARSRRRTAQRPTGRSPETETETDGVAVAVAEPAETVDVPVAVVDEAAPAEYVPMSEWIEDFDSRSRGR